MYRMPSQFDPNGRQDNLAAAGGGSTSTTCTSCIVTLGAASAITASMFANLGQQNKTEAERQARPENLAEKPASLDSSPFKPEANPPMTSTQRTMLGALSLVFSTVAGAIGLYINFVFAIVLFCAVYIGLYCIVYERSRLSPGRGALTAVLMLVAIIACAAFEMYVWMSGL